MKYILTLIIGIVFSLACCLLAKSYPESGWFIGWVGGIIATVISTEILKSK